MRYKVDDEIQNDSMLKAIFYCMVENGIENTTMREISKATGLSASSLYYRFKDKEEIIIVATSYGFKAVSNELFWLALEKINNFDELLKTFIDNLEGRKQQLKFVYQVALSPVYGEHFKEQVRSNNRIIKKYNATLAATLKCQPDQLIYYVELFISVIREYIIWENKTDLKMKLNFIYEKALANCKARI